MRSHLADLARELRYSARTLANDRRFTIVALLTLVLTVASVTTIFAFVHAVLVRPLPYPDYDRLVSVESAQPNGFGTSVAFGDTAEFRAQARSFEMWGLYRVGYLETLLDASSEPLYVHDMLVTADVFPMLGIDVAFGRPLVPGDEESGAAGAVVISHELWQTMFGGDPNVLGRTLELRFGTFSIVGVAQPGANVPRNWLAYPMLWRPVRAETAHPEYDRFNAVARLRPDASVDAARAELAALAAGLAAAHPDTHENRTATVTPLRDEIVGNFKRLLWVFFAAVGCVWLIGVGNLTILQLARNAVREREMAVRAALGASRVRIVRERVVESLLLCSAGGALGLAAAWLVVRLVIPALPRGFPLADQVGVGAPVAAFACGVAVLVGVVVGGVPAWHASAPRLTSWLNEGGRTATVGRSRSRAQRALITVQTAAALMLLISAGLLANSFYRLISRDAGMQEDGLWIASATLPLRYSDEAVKNAFWSSALERVRAIAGVESSALSVNATAPLSGSDILTEVAAEGAIVQSPQDGLRVSYRRVSDDYFRTLGMPLSSGRPILASDVAGAERVVVINELAAAELWPGENALGKRLRFGDELATVVGVIPTFRHARLDGDLVPQIYVPSLQEQNRGSGGAAIVFRAEPGARRPAADVRSALLGLEADLEVTVTTMADVRWRLLGPERFRTAVLLAFAGSAVLLALVGIIGVVAYAVGQRRREIAVRVALGAVASDVLRLTSRQAIVPMFWGLALGLAGAFMATRLLSSFLVDVPALDPSTFAAAVLALALFAAAAAILTARRALVLDPVEVLRSD